MFSRQGGRQPDFERYRKAFPRFIYHGFTFVEEADRLGLSFHFEIPGLAEFRPSWSFPGLSLPDDAHRRETARRLAFALGLVESISYWKLCCPPELVLPRFLSPEQEEWWRKLFYLGLGEYRYLNGIDVDADDFVRFASPAKEDAGSAPTVPQSLPPADDSILVPIGGGKDSAVTLELLARAGKRCVPFMVNPVRASLDTVALVPAAEEAWVVRRSLDQNMLRLNKEGYLNGHTPFSALIAFGSTLVAALTGVGLIALSNEASANEDTIPGTGINHQYSKSYEFEHDFMHYLETWITPSIRYFSFLRPLGELSIAAIFSRHPKFLPVFRSCNVGSKQGRWCAACPKCLFAWTMLLPFLGRERLAAVFGRDMSEDRSMSHILEELAGMGDRKPFECVGTVSEVRMALSWYSRHHPLPPLLEGIAGRMPEWPEYHADILASLTEWHEPQAVPDSLIPILNQALDDVRDTRLDS